MALDFRGQFPVCCAVCAHTCWKYKSYKVFCHELPPICKRVLVYNGDDLKDVTRKFYDLSDMISNRNCSKAYSKIFLHPHSLNHSDNNEATRFTNTFIFVKFVRDHLPVRLENHLQKF